MKTKLLFIVAAFLMLAACSNKSKIQSVEVFQDGLQIGALKEQMLASPWFENATDSGLMLYNNSSKEFDKFNEENELSTPVDYIVAQFAPQGNSTTIYLSGFSVEEEQADFVLADCIKIHKLMQADSTYAGGEPFISYEEARKLSAGQTVALFKWTKANVETTVLVSKDTVKKMSWKILFKQKSDS